MVAPVGRWAPLRKHTLAQIDAMASVMAAVETLVHADTFCDTCDCCGHKVAKNLI